MNIPIFALSAYAFYNPEIDGGFDGVNWFAWLISHVLFEMKMMALFSMLFGAGIVLFIERYNARHGSGGVKKQLLRLGWLFVFGMFHAYVIWEGDILVAYALCGAVALALHRLSARTLVLLGALVSLVTVVLGVGTGFMFEYMRSSWEQVELLGDQATTAAHEWAAMYEPTRLGFEPDAEMLETERAAFLGSYADLFFGHRLWASLQMQTGIFVLFSSWRVLGLMCIGMGLYKLRFWQGGWSTRAYVSLAAVAGGAGMALVAASAYRSTVLSFDFIRMFKIDMWFNYIGSMGVALAWACGIILLVQCGAVGGLVDRVSSVGRMAFTNYIAQSIICAGFFYGYAGGLWSSLSRAELLGVVLIIWVAQLIWSPLWLTRFTMGPLEWLWRSLVDMAPQRFTRPQAVQPSGL